MKWIFILLSLVICNAIVAENYNLSGRVIDKATRQGIADATVRLFGIDDMVTASDSTGHFTVRSIDPGIYRLSVSCIGYSDLLHACTYIARAIYYSVFYLTYAYYK